MDPTSCRIISALSHRWLQKGASCFRIASFFLSPAANESTGAWTVWLDDEGITILDEMLVASQLSRWKAEDGALLQDISLVR